MQADEELMTAIADGDADAFRTLYDRHCRAIHAFVSRYTGGREVDDITQETWLRVARHAPRFDPRRRFTTWCFQIATNLCHDWHRRTERTPAGEPETPVPVHAATPRVDAAIDAGELLASLPEGQRAVMILRYYHDLTEAQVADVLEIPAGTVKSRTHAAMKRLREVTRDDV